MGVEREGVSVVPGRSVPYGRSYVMGGRVLSRRFGTVELRTRWVFSFTEVCENFSGTDESLGLNVTTVLVGTKVTQVSTLSSHQLLTLEMSVSVHQRLEFRHSTVDSLKPGSGFQRSGNSET